MLTIGKNFESFVVCSCSLLFFHQAPQVEKGSGAAGEEEIGDSQEPLTFNFLLAMVLKNLCTISFLLPYS